MSVVLSIILVVPFSLIRVDVIALDMVLGMLVSILVVLLVVVNISDDKIGKVSFLDIGIVKLLVEEALILCVFCGMLWSIWSLMLSRINFQ